MQFPITIGLHRSSFMRVAVGVAHALALGAVYLPAWPGLVKIALAAAVLSSAVWAWISSRPAADALRLVGPGQLQCRLTGENNFIEAELRALAVVHPWLVILSLEAAGRRMVLAVWPDTARAEELRCLRVWLRWRTGIRHPA